jgi:hypothetical protein
VRLAAGDVGDAKTSVYEHFSLMMTEVRTMDVHSRKASGSPSRRRPDPGPWAGLTLFLEWTTAARNGCWPGPARPG